MEDMNELQMTCFEIISYVGTAKSMYINAVQKAKEGDFDAAEELIKQGDEAYNPLSAQLRRRFRVRLLWRQVSSQHGAVRGCSRCRSSAARWCLSLSCLCKPNQQQERLLFNTRCLPHRGRFFVLCRVHKIQP